MQIRPLTEAEMTSASQLVRQVLGEHVEATYPEEAKSAFYAFIEPENLNRMRVENEAILIGCGDENGAACMWSDPLRRTYRISGGGTGISAAGAWKTTVACTLYGMF